MPLSENFRWKVIEAMFAERGFVHHQLSTYNDFIHNGLERVVRESDVNVTTPLFSYTVSFGDVYVPPPNVTDEDRRKTRPLYPSEARDKDLTYDSPVFVDLTETYRSAEEPEVVHHRRVYIGQIPVMVLSSICNLGTKSKPERIKAGECEWDHGGYFIIKGKERVLVGQLRGVYNQTMVLVQKATDKYKYSAEMRSMSEETGHSVLLQAKVGVDNRTIVFTLPYVKDVVPAGVLFKSLGVLTREGMYEVVCGGMEAADPEIAQYIEYIARDSAFVETQNEALVHIGSSALRVIKDAEKIGYARQVVENELFPHMGIGAQTKQKLYLLGDMVNKLIRTHIGQRNPDDRDAYTNKRIEMSGVLCCELFRTLFKKFTKTLQTSIEKKKQKPDIITLISRMSDLTTGLRRAFSTGSWGVPKASYIKTGVSQILQRLSYSSTLSHLRRVAIQMGKDGKNVSAKVRQPHASQIFYIDPTECFDPDTPILTWAEGVKLAKYIVEGDMLVDDEGTPTRVRSTVSGIANMYTVKTEMAEFMDYVVTSNHILTLKIKNNKFTQHNEVTFFDKDELEYKCRVFSTKEMALVFYSSISEDDVLDIALPEYLKLPDSVKVNLLAFKYGSGDNLCSAISVTEKGEGPFVGWQLEGNGRFLGGDLSVLHNTPEGQPTGIVLNLGLSATVTHRVPTVLLRDIVKNCNHCEDPDEYNKTNPAKVLLNGALIGVASSYEKLIEELRQYRTSGLLDGDTSFSYDQLDNEVKIFSDEGRFTRPVYVVDKETNTPRIKEADFIDVERTVAQLEKKNLKAKYTKPDGDIDWLEVCNHSLALYKGISFESLVERQLIQFVDNSEVDNAVLAMEESELTPMDAPETEYVPFRADYMELAPALMLGVVSSTTPFPDHTQCIKSTELVMVPNGPPVPLKDLKVGDEVFTFDPKTHQYSTTEVVFANTRTADKPVYKLTLVTGHSITATHDHRFATNRGWMRLDAIRNNQSDIKVALSTRQMLPTDPEYYKLRTAEWVLDPNETWPYSLTQSLSHLFPLKITSPKCPILVRLTSKVCWDNSFKRGEARPPGVPIPLSFVNRESLEEFMRDCKTVELGVTRTGPMSLLLSASAYQAVGHLFDNMTWITEAGSQYIRDTWFALYCVDLYDKIAQVEVATEFAKPVEVEIVGESMFASIAEVVEVQGEVEIADITVSGDTQSFVCAQFCVHNSSRNIFQASMGKQGIGMYALSHNRRYDTTAHVLTYPQRALVGTIPSTLMGFDEMPYGVNAIVAITSAKGWNQEDSCVVSQAAIDRGMFCATTYKSITIEEPKPASHSYECMGLPPVDKRVRTYNYAYLNERGIIQPRVGGKAVYLRKDDVIVGKILTRTCRGSEGGVVEEVEDVSYAIKAGEEGWVDRVLETVTPNGYKMVKVVVRNERIPERGDKFASRSAQKATAGLILRQEDMPFTQSGIVPDIIINSLAIPSRMTVNVLMETVLGKACCMNGTFGDATPFTSNSENVADYLCEELMANGFEKHGYETMYSGTTGEPLEAQIFIGPTYYLRQKHLVSDKVHCVPIDGTDVLTSTGWKTARQLCLDDELATLDKASGRLIYAKPSNLHFYPRYKGEIYTIGTDDIDLQVTPEHKMWVSDTEDRSKFKLVRMCDIEGDVYLQRDAIVDASASLNKSTESWLDMVGVLYGSKSQVYIFNEKEALIMCSEPVATDVVSQALDFLGVGLQVTKYGEIVVSDENIVKVLGKWVVKGSINEIAPVMFGLSESRLRRFLNAVFLFSDFFSTSSLELADQVQELMLKAGLACIMHSRGDGDFVLERKSGLFKVPITACTKTWAEIGMFCPELEAGIFYVRRNGRATWTGNSRSHGPVTTTTRQPLEGRSRAGGLRTGEMESDVLKSHGTSRMLKERLFEKSDPYQIHVCLQCGNTATSPTECRICESDSVGRANLPFATKLLIQELNAMGIKTLIKLK